MQESSLLTRAIALTGLPGAVVALVSSILASLGLGAQAQEKDNSGSNPVVLSRTLQILNEYRFLPDGSFYNITNLRYTEPFFDGAASARLTIPLDATNLSGDDDFGLGDIAAKFTWVPYVDKHMGVVLTTEITTPTASEDSLGGGKWIAAPGLTLVFFASPEIIIAPAYVQSLSFAGDEGRADVNRGDFDLYAVYKPHGKRWWITSDFTASFDFENDRTPFSWEMAFNRNLAVLASGAAVNAYVRPGIGIGSDRPYDANIEVGVSLVGF